MIQAALIECLENGIPNALQANKPPLVNLLEHLKKRAGDKEWMLKVLGHLSDRNHPFFAKDYIPPKKQMAQTFNYEFDNSDQFFNGLPDSNSKGKHSQAMNLLIPKDQRKQYEIRKAEFKIR